MSGPTGAFLGFTLSELNALKADMLSRLSTGVFTSVSGAGKSSTKQFAATTMAEVQEYLKEINYAINRLSGTLPPRRVKQIIRR